MADIDEIIEYMRSLKKGFDKDLFESKLEELAGKVDRHGLEYNDFHTLLKVWLNLTIPITKWLKVGACLIPVEAIKENTVDYVLRWLLVNNSQKNSYSRVTFVLDWLTAAMDCDSVSMKALDNGYEIFYAMISSEILTAHVLKLVYTLTKPNDVERRRVLELLDYAKKREAKKKSYNHINVILGLFKSYKPECVPENIPMVSVNNSFKKLNSSLLRRFKKSQESRQSQNEHSQYLMWTNPSNCDRRSNKKIDLLIPKMEYTHLGSSQYDKDKKKNCFDFTEPTTLISYSVHYQISRPTRLRALLRNSPGLILLALSYPSEQAFFSYDIYHVLTSCFLEGSPHSYLEKQDLLHRLALFQRTILQGIPVITRFLAQYLPFWNELDFSAELMELVEWVNADNSEDVFCITRVLTRIYLRAQPLEQCAILRALTNMYTNLIYASTRKYQYFMNMTISASQYSTVLSKVASAISEISVKALQVWPEDERVVSSVSEAFIRCARAEQRGGSEVYALPPPACVWTAITSPSARRIDRLMQLLLLYKKIFLSPSNKGREDETYNNHMQVLKRYTHDIIACLCCDDAISNRSSGTIFSNIDPRLIEELKKTVPGLNRSFNLTNHLAFAAYRDFEKADHDLFIKVVTRDHPSMRQLLKKALSSQ